MPDSNPFESVFPLPIQAAGIDVCPEWFPEDKWFALPEKERIRRIEQHERIFRPEPLKESRPGVTRFSTQYGVEWGKKQGWKMLDRERYDARTKRHHDLMLGVDALFDTLIAGMAGVQAAGLGERAAHWQRFCERGGVEKARRLGIKIYYLEFARGDRTPRKVEEWT